MLSLITASAKHQPAVMRDITAGWCLAPAVMSLITADVKKQPAVMRDITTGWCLAPAVMWGLYKEGVGEFKFHPMPLPSPRVAGAQRRPAARDATPSLATKSTGAPSGSGAPSSLSWSSSRSTRTQPPASHEVRDYQPPLRKSL